MLIILAGAAVYSNTLDNPFVFDDHTSITENPSIRRLWPLWRVLMPIESATVTGRPVLNLSFALNYAIGGTDVTGYHIVNIGIHLIASLTLYGLVRRTLKRPDMPVTLQSRATLLAALIALIWCLHPLQTASVTAVVQRSESMMAMCYLLTLYTFLLAIDSKATRMWLSASVFCCCLGMGTKEVMVSAPLVVLLYDRLFITGSFKTSIRHRGWYYSAMAMTWFMLAGLVRSAASHRMAGFNLGLSSMDYALTQFRVISHYLVLAVWPHPLILDYGVDLARSTGEIVPYAAFILGLLAGSILLLIRKPRAGFLCILFFVLLAPSSSIVPIPTQTAAEHRMYLPLASLIILAVVGCNYLLQRIPRSSAALSKLAAAALAAVVVITFGLRTYARNTDYQSVVRIWQSNIRYLPDYHRPYNNLAVELNLQGRYEESLEYLDIASTLQPDAPFVWYNRGIALNGLERYDDAADSFTHAINLDMIEPRVYYHCGLAYSRTGYTELAIRDFTETIRLQSDHINALIQRGTCYGNLKQFQKSLDDFSEVIRLQPDFGSAYENRAICHLVLNHVELARQDIETARNLGENIQPNLIKWLEDLENKRNNNKTETGSSD